MFQLRMYMEKNMLHLELNIFQMEKYILWQLMQLGYLI